MILNLTEYLTEDKTKDRRILTGIEAKTKEDLLLSFSKLFSHNEDEQQKIYRILNEREKLGSTGIGGGYAIPHAKSMGLEPPKVAIITTTGTDFKSENGLVYFAFGVINPATDICNNYLKILGKITEVITRDIFRGTMEKIKNNGKVTQEEIYKLLSNYEK